MHLTLLHREPRACVHTYYKRLPRQLTDHGNPRSPITRLMNMQEARRGTVLRLAAAISRDTFAQTGGEGARKGGKRYGIFSTLIFGWLTKMKKKKKKDVYLNVIFDKRNCVKL